MFTITKNNKSLLISNPNELLDALTTSKFEKKFSTTGFDTIRAIENNNELLKRLEPSFWISFNLEFKNRNYTKTHFKDNLNYFTEIISISLFNTIRDNDVSEITYDQIAAVLFYSMTNIPKANKVVPMLRQNTILGICLPIKEVSNDYGILDQYIGWDWDRKYGFASSTTIPGSIKNTSFTLWDTYSVSNLEYVNVILDKPHFFHKSFTSSRKKLEERENKGKINIDDIKNKLLWVAFKKNISKLTNDKNFNFTQKSFLNSIEKPILSKSIGVGFSEKLVWFVDEIINNENLKNIVDKKWFKIFLYSFLEKAELHFDYKNCSISKFNNSHIDSICYILQNKDDLTKAFSLNCFKHHVFGSSDISSENFHTIVSMKNVLFQFSNYKNTSDLLFELWLENIESKII